MNFYDRLMEVPKVFYIFAFLAGWDAITTVLGTIMAAGGASIASMFFAIFISVGVACLIFSTFSIWTHAHQGLNDVPFLRYAVKGLWGLAWIYNIYTSIIGNAAMLDINFQSFNSVFVLLMATVIVSGSSLVAAYLLYGYEYDKKSVDDF